MSDRHILIAGAGIGGLAAALALARSGWRVTVVDAAAEFGEVGAGIQLGPHAMKVLAALGLEEAVRAVASLPESIVIANASSGKPISRMLLGEAVRARYGQSYVCLHRADLHALLLQAVRAAGVELWANEALHNWELLAQDLRVQTAHSDVKAEALIGADGLWSRTRAVLLHDGAPRATGHAAFRALLPAQHVPEALRSSLNVRVWWARDVHVVSYPLRDAHDGRGGQLWNLVVLAEVPGSHEEGWSMAATHAQVMGLFNQVEPQLAALLQAAGRDDVGWKRWNLFDRAALPATQMAQGRVALLGDAAHPMLPYQAQGAAMALEDAWVLAQCLAPCLAQQSNVQAALSRYAQLRAGRNARVQAAARRNGRIFHFSGPLAVARDAVLALQGTQVLGVPWLYGADVLQIQ